MVSYNHENHPALPEIGGKGMYGAIIGDIVGSVYERRRDRIKTKEFPLFKESSRITDDSVLTIAVARALMRGYTEQQAYDKILVEEMQRIGRQHIDAGFSDATQAWLLSDDPKPYGSSGNGAAMRVSPCGLMAVALEEALILAEATANVSHNHPEGVRGAQAVAAAVYLAKTGHSKEEIAAYISEHFYQLGKTLDEIRPAYRFDYTCQGSVPEAIQCFLESEDYEDAIRNAVSLGGDADTQAAIAGSIAWTYYLHRDGLLYKRPDTWPEAYKELVDEADSRMSADVKEDIRKFREMWMYREGAYERIGMVHAIVKDK